MGQEKSSYCRKDLAKIAAYLLVGFCLYLDLWIGINGASFSLKRFQLSEDLFSIYVSKVYNVMGVGYFLGGFSGSIYFIFFGYYKEYASLVINWLFFIINLILLIIFVTGGENGNLTAFYWTLSVSAFIYGLNEQFVFNLADKCLIWYLTTLDTSAIFTAFLHFVMLKMFGDRTKFDSDFIVLTTQISISVIFILASAILWTYVHYIIPNQHQTQDFELAELERTACITYEPTKSCEDKKFPWRVISPMAMCTISLGIVYAVYPGIAPGMLIDFEYVNKIDQVLLIMAPAPATVVSVIANSDKTKYYGPTNEWKDSLVWWHSTHIFTTVMLICPILFVVALHYPESPISRALVNKPGTTGFLTILFFTSYMILMVVGYTGVDENGGAYKKYIPTINLFISCSTMMVLVFLGEGYITEFKKYDRIDWPTIGMDNHKAFNFWIRKAGNNAWHNLKHVFTSDLRRDLLTALDNEN